MSTQMRIGDTERDNAVERLGEHFAAGRLTKEEFDERSTQASAARYDDELQPLFADLPGADPVVRAAARMDGGWPGRRDPWAAREAWQASRSQGPAGRRPPPFAPIFFVAMVVAVAVFVTPWLLFGLFWMGCLAFHGARHQARRHAAAGGGFGAPAR